MTREDIAEYNEEALLLPEMYDSAIIGIARRCGMDSVAAYSTTKCLEILAATMELDESDLESGEDEESLKMNMAIEYFEYNIVNAWLGDGTPIFVDTDED